MIDEKAIARRGRAGTTTAMTRAATALPATFRTARGIRSAAPPAAKTTARMQPRTRAHDGGAPEQQLCLGTLVRIELAGDAQRREEADAREQRAERRGGHAGTGEGGAEHACKLGRQRCENREGARGPSKGGEQARTHVRELGARSRAPVASPRGKDMRCVVRCHEHFPDDRAPRRLLGARRRERPTSRALAHALRQLPYAVAPKAMGDDAQCA